MIVDTPYGQIEGVDGDGVKAFLGLPYAAPPVGDRRLRRPVPPEPWTGVRAAHAFGAAPVQFGANMIKDVLRAATASSAEDEDCLYLNVWTPDTSGRRPVMVWIYGGGFLHGSACCPLYDGAELARRCDVVVVTINYRLGALGFLDTAALPGDGAGVADTNAGLADQAAALAWVQECIAAFGGDPELVTIFGESAGGIATTALCGVPDARGQFHRVAAQSCVASPTFGLYRSRDAAAETALTLLAALGIDPTDAKRLRDVPTDALVAAHQRVLIERRVVGLPFQPVIDDFMTHTPEQAVLAGWLDAVPLLVGSTAEETRLHHQTAVRQVARTGEPPKTATGGGQPQAPRAALVNAYREARRARGESHDDLAVNLAIVADRNIRIPALRLADALAARGGAAWVYLWAWRSPDPTLGACHAIELPFLFGTLDTEDAATFAGSGPEAEALSAQTIDAWSAFARAGDPSTASLPPWPRYDSETRATMVLDRTCRVERDPQGEERAAWSALTA